jgi:hypothetical protein
VAKSAIGFPERLEEEEPRLLFGLSEKGEDELSVLWFSSCRFDDIVKIVLSGVFIFLQLKQ